MPGKIRDIFSSHVERGPDRRAGDDVSRFFMMNTLGSSRSALANRSPPNLVRRGLTARATKKRFLTQPPRYRHPGPQNSKSIATMAT